MLTTIFLKLQTKINNIKQTLQDKHPSKLGVFIATKIFVLEVLFSFTKYLLILFKNPSESFKIIVNQPALAICPYSYTDHKSFQKRLRVFSVAGLTSLITATIISSLLLNLATGPIFKSQAATYTFTQTNWAGGATANNATHPTNQTGWTEYSAKDANLTVINAGADLQLGQVASSVTQTTNADFNGTSTNTKVASNSVSLNSSDIYPSGVTIVEGLVMQDCTGQTNCFTSLSAWETAYGGITTLYGWGACATGDLTCKNMIAVAKIDGTWTSADTTAVTIDGWTTDATRYIRAYTTSAARHDGKWNTGKYRLETGTGASSLTINVGFTIIDGLQIRNSGIASTDRVIELYGYMQGFTIKNNIIKNGYRGILYGMLGNGSNTYIYNNIIYNTYFTGIEIGGSYTGTNYIYNNTVYGNNVGNLDYGGGISVNPSAAFTYTNNISMGHPVGAFKKDIIGTDSNQSYNITQDTSAAGTGSLTSRTATTNTSPGAGNWVVFTNLTSGSEDFHLQSSVENDALNAGTSFVSVFNGDVDNGFRSGTWDIGADEYGTTQTIFIGTYESSIIDLTYPSNFSTLAWTATVPAQTGANAFRVQMAVDTEGDGPWNYVGTDGTVSTYFTTSGTSIPSTLNNYRYVRYKLYLQTADTAYTPSLDDITLNSAQSPYPASATLTSSPYNSTDSANVIGALSWTEDTGLPIGTGVTFSLRAASSSAGLTSSSWNDFTNATANCSKTTGTVTCPLAAIPAGLKDGTGDQWFQYKATLTSTGANTPTLSNLTIQYVVNAPPQFDPTFNTTGTTATQNTDGTVTIQYQVRDPDTTTGTVSPNAITPSFEYSINGGGAYSNITSAYLSSTDLQNKTVGESVYTLYTATWNPKSQLGSATYVTNAKIRVTLNDNEAANNTANAATANFTLDTTNPVPGTPSLSVNPNSATPGTSSLTISATDNSSLQMKVGLVSDLSDASWETYATSKTITLVTDPDIVYIQFKDVYGNTSSIVSATTPETPTAMMIQDTSNLKLTPPEYRLFAAWKVITIPNPGFKQYNVWRSIDNTTFTQIATITNINTNYYGDSTVTYNQPYYYKVSSQDSNDNISFFSSTIQAQADGIQNLGEGGGGTDGLAPTISSVTTSNIQTTQATITWTTDELSNSTVGYSTDTSFSNETGVSSYVLSHQVTLTNLTPNTTYQFQVKSQDPTGNQSTDNNSGAGYTFTTQSGPKITDVRSENLSNTSVKVIWNTDKDSNSSVVYSTSSNLSSSTETGTTSLVGGSGPNYYHAVTLSRLTQGTTYYYYVKSTDSDGNIAVNNNGLNYYTFKTTQDTTSPTISNITVSTTTPDTAIITWTTNEPSTSQIEYGTTSSYGSTTTQDTDLVLTHIVSITNLTPNTTYNFKVKSKDSSGNESTSTNQTFTTLTENQIKQDQIAPTISSVVVTNITSNSAIITFTSSESCLGSVQYGTTASYDKGATEVTNATTHSITLGNLSASTTYHYQAMCRDSSNNTATSTDQTFTTLAPTATTEGGKSEAEKRVENLLNENFSNEDIQNAIKKLSSPPTITGTGPEVSDIRSNSVKIKWTTDKKSNGVIVFSTTQSQIDNYKSTTTVLESGINTEGNDQDQSLTHQVQLTNLIPGTTYYFKAKSQDIYGNITTSQTKSFTTLVVPLISNVEVNNTTLTSAVVTWSTSVISTGFVEYGKDTNYGSKKEHEDPTTKGTTHTIPLTNLDPTTTYHFRIKGTSTTDNSLISSEDYTFNTQSLPEITKEEIKKITDNSAKVTFQTNIPTDTQVFYKPLEQGETTLSQSKGKPDLTKDHEIELTDLEFGTDYDIQIKVKDASNNEAQKQLPTFTTGIDITPPTISLLRTENALIPGKKDKVQTIITWKTDEPSTTQITYQEGIDLKRTELKEKSQEDKSLTKDHVVVLTTLKPGTVYQLKAISKDNQNNQTTSNNQTMLTPKQQESVFQVIMKNLEDVFGWVKKIR